MPIGESGGEERGLPGETRRLQTVAAEGSTPGLPERLMPPRLSRKLRSRDRSRACPGRASRPAHKTRRVRVRPSSPGSPREGPPALPGGRGPRRGAAAWVLRAGRACEGSGGAEAASLSPSPPAGRSRRGSAGASSGAGAGGSAASSRVARRQPGSGMAASELDFAQLGLDSRLLQATCELGWRRPTPIQAAAIPLALEGRDLLARARTGSGKTAAFALPLLQRLLRAKAAPAVAEQAVRALVLVPSRELGRQALQTLRRLSVHCARDLRALDVSGPADPAAQRPLLMEKPDVVVGTPSRVLALLQAQALSLRDSLEVLVLDEADLLFSFGFEEDLKSLLCHLPKIYQSFLMSATFNEDVQALKELVLHNPVVLKLQESQLPNSSQLSQFQIRCKMEEDKFLLLYALLKLSLVRGKVLLFVNSIDRCYRLKLFLEQFSIPACVLNSELPVQSRCHIISQFNRGFYSYIIATDEQDLAGPEGPMEERKRKKREAKAADKGRDQEYSVSRGIDFQNVSAVINFDIPCSSESYIHRAGRTARADNPGTALTFALHSESDLLETIETALMGESDESPLRPYQFRMEEIEGLRYRCQDAMRSVTKQAIKEARLREIKEELLNSEKLKTYFEDNPRDLDLLRHDQPLHPAIVKPHLRNVPEYLVPPTLRAMAQPLLSKRKRRKPLLSTQGWRNPLCSFKYTRKKQKTPAKGKAAA